MQKSILQWNLECALFDTPIHQFNVPNANKQRATELDSRLNNPSSMGGDRVFILVRPILLKVK